MEEIIVEAAAMCRTVGFLVRDSDQVKVIAHSVANAFATGIIRIPSRAVTRMVRLEPQANCGKCAVALALTPCVSR
jgi:hypothetical protein